MNEQALFYKYLKKIKEAYQASDVVKNPENKAWHYSLSSTPLYKKSLLICGFNWGGDDDYTPQVDYPKDEFMKCGSLGSLSRIRPYLIKYFGKNELENITQTNLCFFRSPKQADITFRDLEINIRIFKELIGDLQPKTMIALSNKIFPCLQSWIAKVEVQTFSSGKISIKAMKGKFNGENVIAYIPHPNYPMKKELRDAIWEYCFGTSAIRQ